LIFYTVDYILNIITTYLSSTQYILQCMIIGVLSIYIIMLFYPWRQAIILLWFAHIKKKYNNILLYHTNGHHTLKRPWCDIRATWTTWRVKDSISWAHYRLVHNCDGRASLRAVMYNVPRWPCDDDGGRERRLHVNTPSRRSTPSSREGSTRDGYLHGGCDLRRGLQF